MTQLSDHRKNDKRLLDDAATGTQRPPRVSIKDNKFALIDPSGERLEIPFLPEGAALDVVFVDRNEKISKLYFGKAYTEDDPSPPLCFSDNGVAPSETAAEPQSATCASCPNNIIGSAVGLKGTKTKACIDLKKLAVVVVGRPGVYLFEIKPGSFKQWNNYINWMRMQKLPEGDKPDLSDVITRVTFISQGVMKFDAVSLIDDDSEVARGVIDVWERNKIADYTGNMVGRYDEPIQEFVPGTPTTESLPNRKAEPTSAARIDWKEQAAAQSPQSPPSTPQPKISQRAAVKEKPKKSESQQVAANHSIQAPQKSPPPTEIMRRLDNLAKLPTVK